MNTKPIYSDNDWFSPHIPLWEKTFTSFVGQELHAIEVGSFEGRSAVWLLEHVLTHPDSTLTCVDMFHSEAELSHIQWDIVEKNFTQNIEPYKEKVTLVKKDSKIFLKGTWQMADIIYIDGSHLAKDALVDGVLAHQLLKRRGIIIFDDYLWQGLEKWVNVPKAAIDAFMECFASEYDVVSLSTQVILQKK